MMTNRVVAKPVASQHISDLLKKKKSRFNDAGRGIQFKFTEVQILK